MWPLGYVFVIPALTIPSPTQDCVYGIELLVGCDESM